MNSKKSNFRLFILSVIFVSITYLTSDLYSQNKHPYSSDQSIPFPKKFEIPDVKNVWHITFTPDGNTFYFITGDTMEVIYYSYFKEGKWSKPKQTEFSGKYGIETPRISPDGKKFFFGRRPSRNEQASDDIYVMDKINSGWGEPKKLDSLINSPYFEAYPSIASNGNLYFISTRDGRTKIYCSKFLNGKYCAPEALDNAINRYIPGDVFISPDESYILFGANESPDRFQFYISFKIDGSWSLPQNLGSKINTDGNQYRLCVSPDRNYLFFTSNKTSEFKIYQVDFKPVLDSLKNTYEVNTISGMRKNIELPTSITFNEQNVTASFSETPHWLKPYIKDKGTEKQVINEINIDGLKAGIYKAKVKLITKNTTANEYSYNVTLNLFEPIQSAQIDNLKNGLRYEYYEDTAFTKIPDFSKMNPKKTGIIKNIDLSVKNRDTLFAIVYNGYINIPHTALYTFFLTSDDGSRLYINDKLCIDNDGLHAAIAKSGNCCLKKGLHKIRIEFTQGTQGKDLELSFDAKDVGIIGKSFSDNDLYYQ